MYDPYAKRAPEVSDPADDLYLITTSSEPIPVGVKALRIWNPNSLPATIAVTTVKGRNASIIVPPECVWVEPLRVRVVKEIGTTPGLTIHGYTDFGQGDPPNLMKLLGEDGQPLLSPIDGHTVYGSK